MSQDPSNSPVDPALPNDLIQQQQPPPPPAPRKRRRRWPWVIVSIVLVLILLVVLGPTIASTGPVRSFVVGKVNDNLNGRVTIAGWSLGWFSPLKVSGV